MESYSLEEKKSILEWVFRNTKFFSRIDILEEKKTSDLLLPFHIFYRVQEEERWVQERNTQIINAPFEPG